MAFRLTRCTLDEDSIKRYEELSKSFKLQNPPRQLLEIYIISNMCEIMGLRAERDHSPEHNVPMSERKLGVQNPNYNEFVKVIRTFNKGQKRADFEQICLWIQRYLGLNIPFEIKVITNYRIDIRHAQTIEDCLSSLLPDDVSDWTEFS